LGVVQHIEHTSKPEKGLANLLNTLEEGVPAIVWADLFSLPDLLSRSKPVLCRKQEPSMCSIISHRNDQLAKQGKG
jgi:hypothetical protein